MINYISTSFNIEMYVVGMLCVPTNFRFFLNRNILLSSFRPSLYAVENSNSLKFREKEINDNVPIHLRICSAN